MKIMCSAPKNGFCLLNMGWTELFSGERNYYRLGISYKCIENNHAILNQKKGWLQPQNIEILCSCRFLKKESTVEDIANIWISDFEQWLQDFEVSKKMEFVFPTLVGPHTNLVGGFNPSEKSEFVSWDDEIPNWMESHKIPWFQTTNQ